ncbi:COG3415 family protein [Gluconobacter cerinus]|uniref:hypothetical protein n=1 Tax=Gluconobacter cerinus TaxID=38307 RepID=UPI001B8CE001|nr:hypothetical protein [Gluconobacter cerinus]MBS1038082.1 hypothetical protein [Gluconobacter cerinus]
MKHIPEKELQRLRSEGKTLSEIANIYNCSAVTIFKKIRQIEIEDKKIEYGIYNTQKKQLNISKEQLIELINEELIYREMGERLNCSESYIIHLFKQYKLPSFKKEKTILPKTELKAYIMQGKTIYELALLYNCSLNTIHKSLNRKNIKQHGLKISKEDLLEQVEQNKTYKEIAEHFSCCTRSIKRYLDKYGITIKKDLRFEERKNISKEELLEQLKQNKTYKEMGEHFNYSAQSIAKKFKKYNIGPKKYRADRKINITDEDIIELIRAGLSFSKIAIYANCNTSSISRIFAKIEKPADIQHTINPKLNISKEDLEKILKEENNYYKIAKKLNCSDTTVRSYCKKYGLNKKALILKEELEEQINMNKTPKEMAEIFNCSIVSVRSYLSKYNLSIRETDLSQQELEDFRVLYKAGLSQDKIAIYLNKTQNFISRKRKKYNITR